MLVIAPLLPAQFSPLRATGVGYQRYLTRLAPELAEVLVGLIGAEAQPFMRGVEVGAPMQANDDLDLWEHRLEAQVETDTSLEPTERETIIRARRGRGYSRTG